MTYDIITDTSADLIWEDYGRLDIKKLSLIVTIGDDQTDDDETVDIKKFYSRLRGGEIAATSQITVTHFINCFSQSLSEGRDVFYIGLSAGLSGTCQSAMIARDELAGRFPDRRIYVGESTCVTLGLGILLYKIADMRKNGEDIDAAIRYFEENNPRVQHRFTVDDLMFLLRGGRVSRTSAVVGSLLGIKPMLYVTGEGKLKPCGKVRGRKASLDALVRDMEALSLSSEHEYVTIVHGDCPEDARYVMDRIKERFTVKNEVIRCLGPTIGAHSGPGTVALFFLGQPKV